MKKHFIPLLIIVLIMLSIFLPAVALADDQVTDPVTEESTTLPSDDQTTQPISVPYITKIEFNGATFSTEFKSDVFEYTVNISSHEDFSLKSYSCTDFNAEIKMDYISNKSGSTKGVIITVKNDAGSNDYKFYFDTVQSIPKSSDTSLIGINFNYGELSPNFKSDVFKYTLYLPSDLEVLIVDPITSDENAVINTPSQISLKKDQNTPISIKVTSSDGSGTATYKLTIKRVDKTIAQIKKLMENPDYKTFVEVPFYNEATFYIITAGCIFAIVLIAVIVISIKKSKSNQAQANAETVASENGKPLKEEVSTNNIGNLPKDIQADNSSVEKSQQKKVSKKETKKLEKAKSIEIKEEQAATKAKAEEQAKVQEAKKAKAEEERAKEEAKKRAEELARAKEAHEKAKKQEALDKKINDKSSLTDDKNTPIEDLLGLDKYNKYK